VESLSRAGGVADVIQQEPHGSLVYNLGEDLTTANQRSKVRGLVYTLVQLV
jgi:hypothetical protein